MKKHGAPCLNRSFTSEAREVLRNATDRELVVEIVEQIEQLFLTQRLKSKSFALQVATLAPRERAMPAIIASNWLSRFVRESYTAVYWAKRIRFVWKDLLDTPSQLTRRCAPLRFLISGLRFMHAAADPRMMWSEKGESHPQSQLALAHL
jgi:hypothetical protein